MLARQRSARRLLPMLLAVLGLPWLILAAGCTQNEATGENILTLLSWDQEIQIGQEAASQFTDEFGGEVPSQALQQYMRDVGLSMASQTEGRYPSLPWTFTLLNSPVVNAFALPGGKVFMSRGLADRLTSEAQLAGVLGHEIGHVTAQHGNQRISQQLGFNLVLTGLAIGVGVADEDSSFRRYGQVAVPALAIGGNLVILKYGRDQELQADALGMNYMTKVGYNPRGQLEVMQLLGSLSGGDRPPEWLSTHPASETRIDQVNGLLRGSLAFTQNNPQYQDHSDRYERRYLAIARSLPPPAQPKTQGAIDWLDTASWCLVCAEQASPAPAAPASFRPFAASPRPRVAARSPVQVPGDGLPEVATTGHVAQASAKIMLLEAAIARGGVAPRDATR